MNEFLFVKKQMRLHQIWYQGVDKAPEHYDTGRKTWRDNHPEWEIMTWDQQSIEALIDEHYPAWRPLYDSLPVMIQKIDVAKVFMAHRYSPCVYADMDTTSLRPLDDLILKSGHPITVSHLKTVWMETAVIGMMHGWDNREPINNGIIVSIVPKHPFWIYYLERLRLEVGNPPRPRTLLEKIGGESIYVMTTTGPLVWTNSINAYNKNHPGSIRVLHYSYLEPIMGMDPESKKKIFPHSYVSHDHVLSWCRSRSWMMPVIRAYFHGIRPYWDLWLVVLLALLVMLVGYWIT